MQEIKAWKVSGFLAIFAFFALTGAAGYLLLIDFITLPIVLEILAVLILSGLTIVEPNESKVLTFFGSYIGTVRDNGLWFTMPLALAKKVSLKTQNFNTEKLKVNDIEGNPIEISAVVVVQVTDPTTAVFNVDSYKDFIHIQSETALRHVATKYPYDNHNTEGYSLRGDTDEVGQELVKELKERLVIAGVNVLDAKLNHLAYATEIASAMLQRQQASAILAARKIIVEGAVGMTQDALKMLEKEGLELDPERKAAMVNNLLVAIVSDRAAQPVINTGSVY